MLRSAADRRQQGRIAIATEVDLTSDDNFYAGRTRDLSVGGLFIETDATLPIGFKIAVRLKLGGKAFALDAEVMWVLLPSVDEPGGIGVSFCDLPLDIERAIVTFMLEREPALFDLTAASLAPPQRRGPPPLPGATISLPPSRRSRPLPFE